MSNYRTQVADQINEEVLKQHPATPLRTIKTTLMQFYFDTLKPQTDPESRICMEEIMKAIAQLSATRAAAQPPTDLFAPRPANPDA